MMTPLTAQQNSARPGSFPPLENGDRLTRKEFEHRFDAMPGLKKAELLEGIVYMPPPVSFRQHGSPHVDLGTLLGVYKASTPLVAAADNSSLRLDLQNMPQPDLCLMILPEYGGQARIDEDDYVSGAPELVAEVAASSASYDLHLKMNVYRRHGVREYIVWRTYEREIDYFVLRGDQYERLPLQNGIYRSEIFGGLWLGAGAMLDGDLAAALEIVHQGLLSPEHALFIGQHPRKSG
jgi:Uma2 family endonuclease